MKFDNKLNMADYVRIVYDIADGYFNEVTGEYLPHIGEIHTMYLYFKNCVIAEDGDEITRENIDTDGEVDLEKLEKVASNEDFITEFEKAISSPYLEYFGFEHAYFHAMDIVRSRVENGGLLVQRVLNGVTNIANTLASTLSEENMQTISQVMEDIKNGAISAESIADAYANSERFKQNTENAKIIELPEQK